MNTMTAELVLALTLWGEARGESFDGKVAVASVIYNRATEAAKGNAVSDEGMKAICLVPKQFSCWNDRTALMASAGEGTKTQAWGDCLAIARWMYSGAFKPSIDADHYHAASIAPWWAKYMQTVARIGNQIFYRA